MSYTMNFSDPTKSAFTLPLRAVDSSYTPLTFYGKGAENYGEGLQENMLHLLENFARGVEPENKVQGQLWFDNSSEELSMKVWDGLEWTKVGAGVEVGASGEAPDHEEGLLFYNTTDQVLYVNDGSQWVALPFLHQLIAHENNTTAHLSSAQIQLINGLTGVSAATVTDLQNQVNTKVAKSGDTMTGFLTLHDHPLADKHAATKKYIDEEIYRAIRLMNVDGIEYLHHEQFTTFAAPAQQTVMLPFSYAQGVEALFLYVGGIRMFNSVYTEPTTQSIELDSPIAADTEISVEKFNFGILNPPSTKGLNSILNFEHVEAVGNSAVLTVPPYIVGSNNLMVWRNGIKRRVNVDYTETNATTITFINDLDIDDVIQLSIFELVGGATIRVEIQSATSVGQQQFSLTVPYVLDPLDPISPLNQDIWIFTQGVYQGKESIIENDGTNVVLADGVAISDSIEIIIFELT